MGDEWAVQDQLPCSGLGQEHWRFVLVNGLGRRIAQEGGDQRSLAQPGTKLPFTLLHHRESAQEHQKGVGPLRELGGGGTG